MARKKIQTYTNGNREARVYRDSEWEEYRTVFYVDGVKQQNADHHTDDKQDAFATAERWVNTH